MSKPLYTYLRSLIALVLLLTAQNTYAQAWKTVGVNDSNWASFNQRSGAYCDIAYSTTGIPYVIYKDAGAPGKTAVRRFVNNTWEFVGPDTFSTSAAASCKIALDPNNVPYIAYITNAGLSVQKFNGTAWVNVSGGLVFTNTTYTNAASVSLAIDGSGTPYICYTTQSSTSATILYAQKFNGTAWVNLGASIVTDSKPTIAVSSLGVPFIAYLLPNTTTIAVSQFNGTAWTQLGGYAVSTGGNYPYIAFDRHDTAYVAYCDENGTKKAMVKKFNGTNWLTVGTAQGTVSAINNPVLDERLCFDINNAAYLSYSEYVYNGITLKKFNGTDWASVLPFLPNNSNYRTYTSVAADPTGGVAQVFTDNGFGKVTVAKCSGTGTGYFLGDMGLNTISGLTGILRITSDNNGTPYAVFNDASLSVKKFDGTNWVYVGGTYIATDTGGGWADIQFDANNTPYVYYTQSLAPYRPVLRKFDGTNWVKVGGTNISATGAQEGNLVFDNSNTPYVTYIDLNTYQPKVCKFNGTSWTALGSTGLGTLLSGLKLDIDKNNNLYLAYVDVTGNVYKATVKKFNGTSWATVGTAQFSQSIDAIDMALDTAGVPYVLHRQRGYPYAGNVQKFDGTSWVFVGNNNFTGSYTANATIHFDKAHNVPYVGFSDANQSGSMTVKRLQGTSWQNAGSPGFTAVPTGSGCSFTITKNGYIYAAYIGGGAFVRGIDIASLCTGPDSVVVSNIGANHADLSWNTTASATSYEYAVLPNFNPAPASGTTTTASMATASGLNKMSFYTAYLRAKCASGDSTVWLRKDFQTKDSCFTPLDTAFNITDSSADISWGNNIVVLKKYEIVINTTSADPATGILDTNTYYHASGLLPSTTYYVHLRSICTPDTSAWTTISFTTPKKSILVDYLNAHNGFGMYAYPNPASDVVNVKLYGAGKDAQVSITDLAGKLIRREAAIGSDLKINISDLPAGLYMLTYTSGNQQQFVKLTKE